MTLPASGPISLLDLQNEFGGTNPIAINEYYAGGPYVGSSLTQLPVAGNPIALDMFHAISANLLSGGKFRILPAASGSVNGRAFALAGSTYISIDSGYSYSSTDDLTTVAKDLFTPLDGTYSALRVNASIDMGSELHALISAPYISIPAKTSDRGKTWTAIGIAQSNGNYGAYCAAARGTLYGVGLNMFMTTYQSGTTYTVRSTVVEDGSVATAWYNVVSSTAQSLPAAACFAPNIGLSQGGDGLFVVVGQYRMLYTSPNGTTWTKRYAYGPGGVITAGDFTACAVVGGKIVIISSDGYAYSSTDGVTFNQAGNTGITSTLSSNIPKLAYINGYLLLMSGNLCSVSTDAGATWSLITQLAIPSGASHTYSLTYNQASGKIVYGVGPVSGYEANYIVQA